MTYPVPVVRLIVQDRENKVLILKRRPSGYAAGCWCLPGGKVEYGQTIEEAVDQELKEETSLVCTQSEFLFFQDSLPINPGEMHCLNLYFRCTTTGTVNLNEESIEFKWIGLGELDQHELVFRNDLALRRFWAEKK